MDTFLLGAGASKAYSLSPSGVRMPLAREVFATFEKLDASEHPWVLTGKILNYVRDKKGVDFISVFKQNYDIEVFYSEVEDDLRICIEEDSRANELSPKTIITHGVYVQLIFLFACIINEIQNGPVSPVHQNLVSQITPDDNILTFNWDTLIDRALQETGKWQMDYGYTFQPIEIFRDAWCPPAPTIPEKFTPLIKLHGSTNWITSYSGVDKDTHKEYLMQEAPNDVVRLFEYASNPYPAFAGRYLPGYCPFSFGYYPPNILTDKGKLPTPGHVFLRARPRFPGIPEGSGPDFGIPSMPLIIPPVKQKSYGLFGSLFEDLWNRAENALVRADRIFVIGYSFPASDIRSVKLFADAFQKRSSIPQVIIVNPQPESIRQLFLLKLGIPQSHLIVKARNFDENFAKD